MSDNINVVVKVRPLIPREITDNLSYQWGVKNNTLYQLCIDNGPRFTFDKVYDETTNTKDVFKDIAQPIVEAAITGINGTIFAYGQTSSGKTYTMYGTDHDPGIIPQTVLTLFNIIQNREDREFLLRVSFIEIYNETIKDLLNYNNKRIKLHEGHQGFKVDSTEKVTSSPEEVLDIMKQGEANRHIGTTNMNEESSRSHTIFQITIESREHTECGQSEGCVNVSTLNLVDLAGSERASQTGATGQRLKEGTFINKSLSTLGLVIKQLSDDPKSFANYRDSILTKILRNSLGGNAKTCIICAVTPAAIEETISTLQFANRAKSIKNKPEVNAVTTNATMIQKLTKQLTKLQSQLEVKKTVEQDNQKLKRQIHELQRQIINGFGTSFISAQSDRRQRCAPRRVTIDTLHTITEDEYERVAAPPRFCTPALKYNPGTLSHLVPTPNALIPRVPEERGLITPPPTIQEKYSEDDSEVVTILSSPEPSKTPPCVLREKAKKAEKNLKDIEELTEREKIYTPTVAELLQKLEEKNVAIVKLEDEVSYLKTKCDSRDTKIDLLNKQIGKTEDELKTANKLMNDLDVTHKKTIIELTDLEVSLDTLKKKAATREAELLSLLEEKNIDTLKLPSKSMSRINDKDLNNFMDLSKDISLVNSDTETSTNDDESNVQELITELQNNLSNKAIKILELESKLQTQGDINKDLQSSCKQMETLIISLKENLSTISSENTLLKSTIEQLNSTINEQKDSLEKSEKDLESYNSLVQELQTKLVRGNKHYLADSCIEEMIINEESILANNENLRNIVHSLKRVIQLRNEEINSLKDSNKFDIESKAHEIVTMTEEVEALKAQIVENVEEIAKLTQMTENNKDLVTQIEQLNEQISILKEQNQKHLEQLTQLNKENEELVNIKEKCVELQNEIVENNESFQVFNTKLKFIMTKIHCVLSKLNCSIENLNIPEDVDEVIGILNNYVSSLEAASSVIIDNNTELRIQLKDLSEKYDHEVTQYKAKIETLTLNNDEDLIMLKKQNEQLSSEISNIRKELEEKQRISDEFNQKLRNSTDDYEKITNLISDKEIQISNLKQKQDEHLIEIEELKASLQETEGALYAIKKEIVSESNKFHKDTNKDNVNDTSQENLSDSLKHSNIDSQSSPPDETTLKVILSKVKILNQKLNIDNIVEEESDTYDVIPVMLDSIGVQVENLTKNISDDANVVGVTSSLNEAYERINDLINKNIKLSNEIGDYNIYKKKCADELEAIQSENKSLASSLMECNELLTSLQHETALKVTALNTLEMNTRKFKDNYMDMELAIQEKISKLEEEKKMLIEQCYQNKKDNVNFFDNDNHINKDICNKNQATPPSLLNICCRTMTDVLLTNQESCSSSAITSYSQTTVADDSQTNIDSELKQTKQENNNLKKNIEFLTLANKRLLEEQEMVRKEISLLVEPAMDLQKKIAKHRTNLSTLTATTYAENKALQSQVKDLLHRHSRLHNVCQKDILQYKKSLKELYDILKTDSAFKRFSLPDVLDKNNSTLDGDLLMLETNVTLATSTDNTLVGHDQSDFDMTQIYLDNDPSIVGDQTLEFSASFIGQREMTQCTNNFTEENQKQMQNFSSIENHKEINVCENCKDKIQIIIERNDLSAELITVKNQMAELEEKYNNLQSETPSVEALVRKITSLEEEYITKDTKITELTNALSREKRQSKQIQDENDTLSSQLMETISEDEVLRKELDCLKDEFKTISDKCKQLEAQAGINKTDGCAQCKTKDKMCKQFFETESLLNKSRDLDTSLRHSKICTLQNELHASKEDCKKINEEVATIKNHLDRSNLSMNQDMDDSMGESNIFTFTKDFVDETETVSSQLPSVPVEKSSDFYFIDKQECFDFFVENKVVEKENLNQNSTIIDILKMFHNNLIVKHGNEVENLLNKLKDFEESNNQLKTEVNHLSTEYNKTCKDISDVVSTVKNNISALQDSLLNITDSDRNTQFVATFKRKVLNILDREFAISTSPVFEALVDSIVTKHQKELTESMERFTKLNEQLNVMQPELININEDLVKMKTQLSDKENEYNLLKAQKDKIREISSAVTLDMIKKEHELRDFIADACQMLLKKNLIEPLEKDMTQSPIQSIKMLLEKVAEKRQQDYILQAELEKQKENLISEVQKYKITLEDGQKELSALKSQNEKTSEINMRISTDLIKKDEELLKQSELEKELRKQHMELIEKNKQETDLIKNIISEKDALIESLSIKLNDQCEMEKLLQKIEHLESELSDLKRINEMITKENETYSEDLKKAGDCIQAKNEELEKVTKLTQSVKSALDNENSQYKSLKAEIDSLSKQVDEAREKYEAKCKECTRLERNIKTHEKSVEIQSSMVKRLQQQKLEDGKRIEELSGKCTVLEAELNALQSIQASTQETVISLQDLRNTLEVRITDLEAELSKAHKERPSLDALGECSRRRRQSLHDSKRMFADDRSDCEDANKMEAMFASRSRPRDMFMDEDEGSSSRSTPARNNSDRRRDSFLARMDQSDRESEGVGRSVHATRRRRQSIHDMHRSAGLEPTESLLATRLQEELEKCDEMINNSEVATLKATLSSCKQELEELRERYKELDEECETCAEYLRERDEQCLRLKKEKAKLEESVIELKKQVDNQPGGDSNKRSYSSVAVNTDEDWANLHSVVVDRMSFNAEVEKNKTLMKAIEEFRLKNRDLKATVAKMQKALEKYAGKDGSATAKELESAKKDLKSCQQELEELKQRYRELDEECETCADYLREKDEQCKKLKEAKAALEAKLEELEQERATAASQLTRKKRQSLHDQNRETSSELVDATTETSEDSYQANGDGSSKGDIESMSVENHRLRMLVNSLTHRKSLLEQKLQMMAAPMYVATGSAIVQNQQLSDMVKENQKLKKINAKLVQICKKRGKSQSETNRDNDDTSDT